MRSFHSTISSTLLLFIGACSGSGADGLTEDTLDLGSARSSVTSNLGQNAIVGMFGKCLSAPAGGVDGSPVVLSECQGRSDQMWSKTSAGEIKGIGGKCLNAEGFSSADGTRLVLYTCDGGANEVWSLTSEKWIRGIGNKCASVQGGSHADGSQVVLAGCASAASYEKWSLQTTVYEIPIELVVVRQDDGSGFSYDQSQFSSNVSIANNVYARAGIKLTFNSSTDATTLNSTLLYDNLRDQGAQVDAATDVAREFAGRFHGKLVMFIVPTGDASYSSTSPDDLNFVSFGNGAGWPFILHETGHYFGLEHTHYIPGGISSVASYLATATNGRLAVDGDYNGRRIPVLDTEPDPTVRAWEEAGKDPCSNAPLLISGMSFDPDKINMMAYTRCNDVNRSITPDQIGLIRQTLQAPDRVALVDGNIPLSTTGIAIGQTIDGRTQMYAVGQEGRVATRWKTGDANSGWTGWNGFDATSSPTGVATLRHNNNRSEVFLISSGSLLNRYQFDDQGHWTDWSEFWGNAGFTDVETSRNVDGRPMMWAVSGGTLFWRVKTTAYYGHRDHTNRVMAITRFGSWRSERSDVLFLRGLAGVVSSDGERRRVGLRG